jgi:hypothetical protein
MSIKREAELIFSFFKVYMAPYCDISGDLTRRKVVQNEGVYFNAW